MDRVRLRVRQRRRDARDLARDRIQRQTLGQRHALLQEELRDQVLVHGSARSALHAHHKHHVRRLVRQVHRVLVLALVRLHVTQHAVVTLSVRITAETVSTLRRRYLTLAHGRVLLDARTHGARRLAVHEEVVAQRQRRRRDVDLELVLSEPHDARLDRPRLALTVRHRLLRQLQHRHVVLLARRTTVHREAQTRHGEARLPRVRVEATALQVLHHPRHVRAHGRRDLLVGGGRQVEEVGQRRRVRDVALDRRVAVQQHRALAHAEHARRVEHHGHARRLATRTVHLERHHVLACGGTRRVQDHVELGGNRLGDGRGGLRRVGEALLQVEARHASRVHVRHQTARVLHAHVQHGVVVDVGDGELVADVRRHAAVHADVRCLVRRPVGGREVHGVPVLGRLRVLQEGPVVVVDLEGKEGGEEGGDGTRADDLTRLEADVAHVDGEVPAGRVHPAVLRAVEEVEVVEVVGQAPVGVVESARDGEGVDSSDGLAGGGLSLIELVGALLRPVVETRHQRDQRLAAVAHRDGDRDHSRGGVAIHLRGSDGVGVAASSSAVNGARDHTRVHVDRKSLRKGGGHGVVVDQLAVGVQLRHLDVLVDLEVLSRGQVLQVGDIHIERHAEQIQTVEAPAAGLGRAGEVLEAVLVPRLVLLDVDHLALAHQRPGQSRHLLQRRPLLLVAVARLQVESHGLAVLLHVVELHRHSADPLATVVVEGDLEAVGLAHHAVIEIEVVVLEEVVVLALAHALSSDGERAEHTGLGGDAHEADGAVEERRLRRGRRHQRDRDRVRALLDVVHAGRRALHVRLDGQRNGAVLHAVVDVLSDGGGAQVAHHAVAEHLAVVHVDHATELVAQRDHEARVLLQRRHGERLLVQLNRIGGVGERAHRALRPAHRL